jgi:hypothetical protein
MAPVERIVVSWRNAVLNGSSPGPHWVTVAALEPIVHRLADCKGCYAGLFEFGRRCGLEGHPLEDCNAWMAQLAKVSPRRLRNALDRRDAAIAISRGWTSGVMERGRASVEEVVSLEILRYRIEQQYARCQALGVDIQRANALVIFDLLPAGNRAPSTNEIATALAKVQRQFSAGETISATAWGRIVVLVERATDTADRVRRTIRAAQACTALTGCAVRGWIEPLASERTQLEPHLASLF